MPIEISAIRNVAAHYGPRTTTGQYGGAQTSKDTVRKAQWDFDYLNLPTAGATNLQFVIPANSSIVRTSLIIDSPFTATGGTPALTVGLRTSAGVVIANDGLVTAANATNANINIEGRLIVGSGALVGTTIGTAAGELQVAASGAGTFTGGKARVIVEYIYHK